MSKACPKIIRAYCFKCSLMNLAGLVAIDAKEVVKEVFVLINLKEEIIKYYQGPAPLQI